MLIHGKTVCCYAQNSHSQHHLGPFLLHSKVRMCPLLLHPVQPWRRNSLPAHRHVVPRGKKKRVHCVVIVSIISFCFRSHGLFMVSSQSIFIVGSHALHHQLPRLPCSIVPHFLCEKLQLGRPSRHLLSTDKSMVRMHRRQMLCVNG